MKKHGILLLGTALILGGLGLASCSEETNEPPVETPTSTVTISGNPTCEVGATSQLSATVTNDNTREGVTWSSSNTAVATVSDSGLVTGVSVGTATITATMVGNIDVKAEVTFTVTASTEPSIAIKVASNVGQVGTPFTLTADVYNPMNRDLSYTWSTKNGLVTISDNTVSEITVTPNSEGDEVFTLRVMIGQTPYETSVNVYFGENYSSYTEISTKAEFESIILNDADKTLDGKYCLTSDIDLEGLQINGLARNLNLTGVLDGRGHSLINYEIVGNLDAGFYPNTNLFKTVGQTGIIRNLHLKGETKQQGVGWGSSILAGNLYGTVQNCLIEYTNSFNQTVDGWFPFTGAVCGVLQAGAVVNNCVVSVTGDGQGGAMAIAAYPEGSGTAQAFKVSGVYTNQASAATFGSSWDWGGPISNATSCKTDLNFTATSASTYNTLSPVVWSLVDNQMPSLNNL